MVEEVQADMRAFIGHPLSEQIEKALRQVERHEFVPVHLQRSAYENRPLPIGSDQTISQPFIVALMTELLSLGPSSRVLEVGTGSGYQSAVLAEICEQVYSIEIIGSLASEASQRLLKLGYINVSVRHGDGTQGWPQKAPFDGIIVTAAGLDIPQELLNQLKPGGSLVMPVGSVSSVQQLKVIKRNAGGFSERDVLPVRFVPITHDVR
ncbi:MAG: protein-L-isoaspartate(D-aspartate) O-methyltransferase [Gammaproteobacteria bacterium]|nr:protein-L-isoaspartate(D-aspartate) O-methyltransferase [Gammaproteobacteria bacterium]MBT4492100.1 protein-L-isoaspartate(D-aspartate) O-methyltransferase [Gammaproteobacteria bacterium]MBT7369613.1 protein-L-isoaspartate(D-aspartate) O-methyltransferase [Gammaproteobacteria bacterium]